MGIIDFILNIDEHLRTTVNSIGPWSYAILFGIVFVETGLVIVPFLPGDSLLFATGTLAAGGLLSLGVVIPLLIVAAILGDSLNYYLGHRLGPKVFSERGNRLFKPEYLQMTEEFYAKHGRKTIILARFLPIVRSFAPFVAGVGSMKYQFFLLYNVIGAVVWVVSLTLAGYFFGRIPIVKNNFEYAIILIIVISIVPAIVEFAKHHRSKKATSVKANRSGYRELKETFKKEHMD